MTANMARECKDNRNKRAGLWFLASIILFFITFASVDAYFVYKAVSTHTGVVRDKTYERGINFNKNIEQAHIQKAEGFKGSARYKDGALTFALLSKDDAPVDNAVVTAFIQRPSHTGYDMELPLAYQGDGIYTVNLDLPLNGLWKTYIDSKWEQQQTQKRYQTSTMFVVN